LEREGNKRLRGLGTGLYRLTGGRITPRDRDVLLLTTRGRKSGREHTVLLQAFRDGEDLILVAANAGGPNLPDWFRNLEATPTARVELMDRTLRVRAERLPDEEAAAFWPGILRRAPTYARYRKAAGRAIPLVRLVPVGRTTGDVRPLPLKERIKTRIEHEVDARSVGLAAVLLRLTKVGCWRSVYQARGREGDKATAQKVDLKSTGTGGEDGRAQDNAGRVAAPFEEDLETISERYGWRSSMFRGERPSRGK
jgi:F420H(2)-dependent quinone reductase